MKKKRFVKQFILLRLLIILLGIIAIIMVPSLIIALVTGEAAMIRAFAIPIVIVSALAGPSLLSLRKKNLHLNVRDGFLLVFLTWVLASLLGAIPYLLSGHTISITDSIFESTCSFATTGATTIIDVEALPRSLLFWRSIGYWFGGIGIVFITVALMPLLGVGGFQLIKAEASGPEKEKITPKITVTAKLIFLAYGVLTAVLILLYRLGGMDWFDAICHSFTVMATGGVSTKNAGIAYFNSGFIDGVSAVFMLLAGLNFSLYYRLLQGKFRDVLNNTEARAYLVIFLVSAALVTIDLIPVYGSPGAALRRASYQTASILSSTGSVITDYGTWPSFTRTVLFLLMFIGGCSGSTAGGIKVIRHVVLFKQMVNELRRLIYPKGVFSIQLNKKVGRKDVIYGAAGFFFLYLIVVAVTALITAASGIDVSLSFSAALSITSNIGTGFDAAGPHDNYSTFPNHIKWLFSFVMIAGRLELWTVLVIFTPAFWRR